MSEQVISKKRIRELCEASGMKYYGKGRVISTRETSQGFPMKHLPIRIDLSWNILAEICLLNNIMCMPLIGGRLYEVFLYIEKEVFWQPTI